jgi:hypothetical protein
MKCRFNGEKFRVKWALCPKCTAVQLGWQKIRVWGAEWKVYRRYRRTVQQGKSAWYAGTSALYRVVHLALRDLSRGSP